MSRSSVIRKMNGVQHAEACMLYPYNYIGEEDYGCDYALDNIRRSIMTEAAEADAGDFPQNIQEHFWIRPGQNDGDSWMACGVLSNGNYFFFTGGCDYTGFGCRGGMNLWVSSSWGAIVEHAMCQSDYDLYVENTAVPPAEGEAPWPELTEEEFWAERRRHIRCHDCGEAGGAEHEHPYIEHEMLCEACYKQHDSGPSSGPCLVCKAEDAIHEHPLSCDEQPLFLCDVCNEELRSGPDPRAWVGRALAHRDLIAAAGGTA